MRFADRVLAKTSGPACPSAEERFVAFFDGELDATDRALVAAHAARCPACRAGLARVSAMLADLPHLAEVATDPAFVNDVLRKTAHAPAAASRWAEAWRRFALRPRFAMEVAYVGAVVLCLIGTFTDLHVRSVPDLLRTMISDIKETR